MATATKNPTIKDLIEFVFDNPGTTPFAVGQEFNISTTDAEEILSGLDNDDGTLYFDGDSGYSVEDKEASLEDVLTTHHMGGGRKLTEELPVSKPKASKKKKASKKASTTDDKPKTTKKKTTKKAKPKATKPEATEDATEATETPEAEAEAPKPKKKRTRKKAAKKAPKPAEDATETPEAEATETTETPKAPKTRNVQPRASRIVEDEDEAKGLGVDVGTEVKTCVDCRNVYAKFGGMFRPRWRDPEGVNASNPDAKAHAKHVQPRCIDCDKKRSRRKSRFTALRRVVGIEDIGNPEKIISHPDRKSGGVPDGKFSVALVDDTVDGFEPNLRGVLVSMCEGLIKLRWMSGDDPEIIGATKKAIAATKAPTLTEMVVEQTTKKKAKKKASKKAPKPEATPEATEDSSEDASEGETETKTKPRVLKGGKTTKKKAKRKTKAEKAAEKAAETPW